MPDKPQALRRGDLVTIVSPSARVVDVFPARIDRARNYLEDKLGLKVKIIYNKDASEASFSEAVRQRCDELHEAFRDPTVKGIICAIGGLSANELLRHLDYDLIGANPKVFVGYSDITLLHHAFATQANLRTFYGPAAVTQFGEYPEPLQFSVDHFKTVLFDSAGIPPGPIPRSPKWTQEFLDWGTGADTSRPRHLVSSSGWKWLRQGKAQGRLSGGCLPSLLQLTGTKYMPSLDGCILILENPEGEKENVPFPLDLTRSNVADLVNVGVFDGIAGLVLGRPYQYDEVMTAQYEKMFLDQCSGKGMDFPILANIDVGHTDPIVTLPLGCMASLDSSQDLFDILESATENSNK